MTTPSVPAIKFCVSLYQAYMRCEDNLALRAVELARFRGATAALSLQLIVDINVLRQTCRILYEMCDETGLPPQDMPITRGEVRKLMKQARMELRE